jgi:serine/threonine protein kinase
MAVSIGDLVGHYTIIRKLGEGGFSEVYLARDAAGDVAIKFAKDTTSVGQFRRLLKVQSKINSHHVVGILDSDLDASPARIVMDLVDGCNLRDVIDKIAETGAWSYRRPALLYVLKEIAAGLRDAHKAGISHLDLKPSNVLISSTGEVKLTDFEFSRTTKDIQLSLSLATVESLAGTLAYMSPEQRRNKNVGTPSDIYTFGVIMFEALTGDLPQPGDMLSDFIDNDAYDRIFSRCFSRPHKRFRNGNQLFNEFDKMNKDLVNRSQLVSLLQDFDLAEKLEPSPVRDELISNVVSLPEKPKPKVSSWGCQCASKLGYTPAGGCMASKGEICPTWIKPKHLAEPARKTDPGIYKLVVSRIYKFFDPNSFNMGTRHIKKETFYLPITIPDIIDQVTRKHGPGDYVLSVQTEDGEELKTKTFSVAEPKPESKPVKLNPTSKTLPAPKPAPKPVVKFKRPAAPVWTPPKPTYQAPKLTAMEEITAGLAMVGGMIAIPGAIIALHYIFGGMH